MQKNLYIKTYGCQMNVYDSDKMADLLKPLGYHTQDSAEDADLLIFNTCHIREKAAEKLYSDLGRAKHLKQKGTTIVVAGCVAQAEGAEVRRRAPYVDMVVGPQNYQTLPKLVRELADKDSQRIATSFDTLDKFDNLPQPERTTTSAFLTIQEGCDKFCTFCVVPYTRGAEISRQPADIIAEARQLVALGAREITLLGQNVNAYHGDGADGKTWGLARLLYALAEIDGLERLRYTTSHPRDMDEALIKAHGDIPALMPFLHLPVQSGSNNMLQAMNRQHTVSFYRTIIDKLRHARSDIAFSSDFIVGYPGETAQDFADTYKLVEDVFYAQAYSFAYSARPGTPASMNDAQLDPALQKARLQQLQALLMQQQRSFNESFIGKTVPVLLEKQGRAAGQLVGRAPYGQTVTVAAPPHRIGQIADLAIVSAKGNTLQGTLPDSPMAQAA